VIPNSITTDRELPASLHVAKALDLGGGSLDDYLAKLYRAIDSLYPSTETSWAYPRAVYSDHVIVSVYKSGEFVLMRHSCSLDAGEFKLGAGERVREVVSYVLTGE
jgi:hypothetical protein